MLRVIKPVPVTDAALVSHTVADSALPVYSAGTTYALADTVQYQHWEFESLQGGNLNHLPDIARSTEWWLRVGPANRWAMFDGSVSTATTAPSGSMEVVLLATEFITAVGLAAVVGVEVRVRVQGAALVDVYDQTQVVSAGSAPNPYDWCFGDREDRGDLIFSGLPPYLGGRIVVTFTGSAGLACGVLVMGRLYELGSVEAGAQAGITSYSRKKADEYGTTELLRRPNAKRMSLGVLLEKREMRFAHQLLADLDSVPCMWSGDEDADGFGPLQVFGWYRDFRQVVEYADWIRMSVEVEGLT